RLAGTVVGLDRSGECFRRDLEFLCKLSDGVRFHLGDLLDAIFVAQPVDRSLIEDLHGRAVWLAHDRPAKLDVGEVSIVLALIDEPISIEIDQYAKRIGVLLKVVEHPAVAERRRGDVPANGMAARPIAERHRTDIDRHADAVAGVVARATYASEIPALTEIAHAHLRVR